jgi:hypothetical protein
MSGEFNEYINKQTKNASDIIKTFWFKRRPGDLRRKLNLKFLLIWRSP